MTPFQKALLDWYAANRRRLPWRDARDPYRIWVSEIMLQQTQAATVVPYYQRFVEKHPDVRTLAAAPLEDVLKSWEGLGYYARARNLHRAARIVSREMGGEVPRDPAAFRSLPGVGEYVAAAVMSIAYGLPHAVLDGNVRRVLARIFLIGAPAGASSAERALRERAESLLDRSRPGEFNQALMELGALVCTPKRPACAACPVSGSCAAFAASLQSAYPVRAKRRPAPEYHVALGVVRRDGRMLITRRKEEGLLGGLWEFPGGKVRPGEDPEDACKREIAEEVGLTVEVTRRIARVRHAYTHFKIIADVFDCEYRAGEVTLRAATEHRWILVGETSAYPFPALNHKIFPHLAERERSAPDESP